MKQHASSARLDPREVPAYGLAEAARYLNIPHAALRSWVAVTPQRMKELAQSPGISVSAAFQGIITPQRMRELEQSAPGLLHKR